MSLFTTLGGLHMIPPMAEKLHSHPTLTVVLRGRVSTRPNDEDHEHLEP